MAWVGLQSLIILRSSKVLAVVIGTAICVSSGLHINCRRQMFGGARGLRGVLTAARRSEIKGNRGKQRIVTLRPVAETNPPPPPFDEAAPPRAVRVAFAPASSLAEAQAFTRQLAHPH